MVKYVVTPQNTECIITIPSNYIGKKVEIVIYALDEVEEKKLPQKNRCRIIAESSPKANTSLSAHIEQVRDEWDRHS